MRDEQAVVFLPGLGDRPETWTGQVGALPPGLTGIALGIRGLHAANGDAAEQEFSLAEAAKDVVDELDRRGIARAHLCGHSLGAMVALQIAHEHPGRVRSLVLASGQVRPPRALMALQSAVMRLLPARLVAPEGTSKGQLLAVLREVARTDLTGHLAAIAVPTLVLCGARDRPNLPAARAIAAGIPGARLRILDGAGHGILADRPEAFAHELHAFLPG
ncbi:alpha/beta fold hydrolase [Brachybacterium hainanense]|uniref:Alpha/beta fold hydrolase n=1 Tax=Brachybacterium hainanense TaxID=1541174 RepID=A0ABV6RAB8_9MICO